MRACLALLLGLLMVSAGALASGPEIQVKMLAEGSALLLVDGKQRMLRVGKTSPEGITLVTATSQRAVIEWRGERQTLGLSRQIATRFTGAERAEVRLAAGAGGHFMAPGRINGLPVRFMVDTGATAVAMNYHEAERLGLDYLGGTPVAVSTANGTAQAYLVTLTRVSVGAVELQQVPAMVHDSDSPGVILLGNSFLSKVDMQVDQGVLVLRAKQ